MLASYQARPSLAEAMQPLSILAGICSNGGTLDLLERCEMVDVGGAWCTPRSTAVRWRSTAASSASAARASASRRAAHLRRFPSLSDINIHLTLTVARAQKSGMQLALELALQPCQRTRASAGRQAHITAQAHLPHGLRIFATDGMRSSALE